MVAIKLGHFLGTDEVSDVQTELDFSYRWFWFGALLHRWIVYFGEWFKGLNNIVNAAIKKGRNHLRKHIQSIHTTEGKKEWWQRVFIEHEDSQITEIKIILMCATFTFNK